MRKIMVFGVFDGVHKGHREFFREAKSHGDHLIVAVALDDVVRRLKGHLPKKDLAARMTHVQKEEFVDEVVAGDEELGTYKVIVGHKPDVIALGYDQKDLEEDLKKNLKKFDWPVAIVIAGPHRPNRYHSSLLKDSF